ncbi:hypothetical protein BGX24_008700 [Mortierella sp. AD032]|nr:hypothetical protein BGX24_008700 [Mortierella sp. AD032]
MTEYKSMFIVPHCSPRTSITQAPVNPDDFRDGQTVACSIDADKVTVQGQYSFDIVFSSLSDTENSHPYSYFVDTATSTPRINNKHVALTLLRDPASVDVAFIFEDENAFNGVALWAHRSVLSKHRVFEELIQQGKVRTFGSDKQGGTTLAYPVAQASTRAAAAIAIDPSATAFYERDIFITLKNVSLTTMCALLYYIYTSGVIDLSTRLGRFAISRCVLGSSGGEDATRMVWCDTEGRFDASHDWHPLENHSPWQLRDVTWSELWEVSTLFGIADLQTLCRDGVIKGIVKANAVDVLFSKAAIDVDIKNAAMMKVVEDMSSIFDKDKDPFAPYKHHQEYHDLLIQLMRLKSNEEKPFYFIDPNHFLYI